MYALSGSFPGDGDVGVTVDIQKDAAFAAWVLPAAAQRRQALPDRFDLRPVSVAVGVAELDYRVGEGAVDLRQPLFDLSVNGLGRRKLHLGRAAGGDRARQQIEIDAQQLVITIKIEVDAFVFGAEDERVLLVEKGGVLRVTQGAQHANRRADLGEPGKLLVEGVGLSLRPSSRQAEQEQGDGQEGGAHGRPQLSAR